MSRFRPRAPWSPGFGVLLRRSGLRAGAQPGLQALPLRCRGVRPHSKPPALPPWFLVVFLNPQPNPVECLRVIHFLSRPQPLPEWLLQVGPGTLLGSLAKLVRREALLAAIPLVSQLHQVI